MSLTVRFLIVTAAVSVGPSLWSRGQDGLPPSEPQSPLLVSVMVRQQAAPRTEQIPAPGITPNPAAAHDEDLIGRALVRPQPADSPAKRLDQGGQLVHGSGMIRQWDESVSMWEAPAFCHRPLYFEDENLERHGRSWGLLQPAASIVHFTGRGLAWPYLAGAFPSHECIYTLGRDQPGSDAPYHWYRPPVSARGAVYEAAVATGFSFIVP
jgi:hypothetical protein